MKLKVLTFNTHKFRHPFKRNYVLKDLRELLATMDLDIVFLQELVGIHPTNRAHEFQLDPLEHLADQLWNHYAYGKNAVYTNGHHGNAILSKHPIHFYENHDISNHRFERRGFLKATIFINDRWPLNVFNLHLDLTHWGRQRQIHRIIEILQPDLAQPFIMAGDFNDWRNKIHELLAQRSFAEAFSQLERQREPTFPSLKPLICLDRIYFMHLRCIEVKVLNGLEWSRLSDHCPVHATFELECD